MMHVGASEPFAVVFIEEPVTHLGVTIHPPIGALRRVTCEPALRLLGDEARIAHRSRLSVEVEVAEEGLARSLAEVLPEEQARPAPSAPPLGVCARADAAELLGGRRGA